jgi:PAS domain S-box-containing protein
MAVAIFDRDACFLACNQQFVTECDVKFDPIGRHFHEVFPETGDHWTNVIQRGVAGESLSAEFDPFVWSDGTVSVIRWEVKPWKPIDDEIVGAIVIVKVLSDDAEIAAAREQIEERFRNEQIHYRQIEQRHRNILELSSEIMFVCSFSGQVFECNSAMHKLFGVDVLNTPPHLLMERIHPQDRQSFVYALRNSIDAGQAEAHVQTRCLGSSGVYHWLDWRFSIMLESHLILAVARDITDAKIQQEEQKRMLLALKQSEERLLQAERIAGIGYWESNLDGSAPHFSEGVYSIYGLSDDYPLTSLQDLWAFTNDNRYGSCLTGVYRAITTGQPFEFEYAIRRPDGEVRTLYGRGEPLYDQSGTMIKLQGIIQDITDRVNAAARLRQHGR